MVIVQSQWWYQYVSKESTRGGSGSSRPQHVDGLRVHPRMDVQDPDRNEQDLRQPGTILKLARSRSTVTVPDGGGSSRKGSDSLQFP